MREEFPRLYPIVDVGLLAVRAISLSWFAEELRAAGVQLVQYRNKQGSARAMLHDGAQLRAIFANSATWLIFNDRADLALLSGFHGVHLGQEDLAAEDARVILGAHAWVGVSTHSSQQIIEANETSCDYIAYGPIFATASKAHTDPTVGLAGLHVARSLTRKPIVAIGGITRANCRSVLDTGADSVAVISDLLPVDADPDFVPKAPHQIVEEFLALLG